MATATRTTKTDDLTVTDMVQAWLQRQINAALANGRTHLDVSTCDAQIAAWQYLQNAHDTRAMPSTVARKFRVLRRRLRTRPTLRTAMSIDEMEVVKRRPDKTIRFHLCP